jgi:hypothetical protein
MSDDKPIEQRITEMPDDELIEFAMQVAEDVADARRRANFDRYDKWKPIVDLAKYEMLQRMKRRHSIGLGPMR